VFVWLGSISYVCYLIHAPLLDFTQTYLRRPWSALAGFGLTVVIAWLSWHVLESRCLALKDRWFPSRPPPPA